MARKKGGNVIGFDPLAWMKQPESSAPEEKSEPVVVAPTAPAIPDPAPTPAPTASLVALGDALTIEQASSLHQAMAAQLATAGLVVEAGAVRRVDTAGLQLLLAFVRERERRGMAVTWQGVSAPLREAASRLGLEPVLHFN